MRAIRRRYIATPFHRSLFFQPHHIHASSLVVPHLITEFPRALSTFSKSQFRSTSSRMTSTIMPAQHGHSEACCNIPPIVVEGYKPKGKYETIGGMKHCTRS